MENITVKNTNIAIIKNKDTDYISLTDIAKFKTNEPNAVIANWLRNRNTIEYLGIWETLYNPNFKPLEFERFRIQSGVNFQPQCEKTRITSKWLCKMKRPLLP